MDQQLISMIADEIVRQLLATGNVRLPGSQRPESQGETMDITSPACKAIPLLDSPRDPDALARMMKTTTARIGVGHCGPRLKTQTMLALRADHAQARDAVFADVSEEVLKEAGLVRDIRRGKYIFYELNTSVLEDVLVFVSSLGLGRGEESEVRT